MTTDTPTTAKVRIKRRRGSTYVTGIDWDFGTILTSKDRYAALDFDSAAAAKAWAKEQNLDPSTWKLVRA